MAIGNAVVVKYLNENLRPIAEQVRALNIKMKNAKDKYDAEIAVLITSNAANEVVMDGRDAEGVSRVTKNDILLLIAEMNAAVVVFDTASNLSTTEKFAVRPLLVE